MLKNFKEFREIFKEFREIFMAARARGPMPAMRPEEVIRGVANALADDMEAEHERGDTNLGGFARALRDLADISKKGA